MYTVPRPPRSAEFRASATVADVAGVLAANEPTDNHDDPDRAAAGSRGLRGLWGRSGWVDDASMWWGNWVPVATTGWGALFLIALLLVAGLLLRVAEAWRRDA